MTGDVDGASKGGPLAGIEARAHVVLTWSSDYEQAWLEEGAPGEAKDTPNVYEADVAAQLWAALIVAQRAYSIAHRRVLEAIGFDEEKGRMATACPTWEGEIYPGHSGWRVVLAASGDGDHWPVNDVAIASAPTERDAMSFLESLPPEFFVLASYGQGPGHVHRDRLRVESAVSGPWTSACYRCGWPLDEHDERDPILS